MNINIFLIQYNQYKEIKIMLKNIKQSLTINHKLKFFHKNNYFISI